MSDGNAILQFPPSSHIKCYICGDTTDYKLQHACHKCGQTYCTEHASKYDPLYCEHCVFSVSIVEEEYQRTETKEDYDEETDTVNTVVIKSPVAHKTEIFGADWVFLNNVIRLKTEDELKLMLKLYKAAVSAMEMELTCKQVKRITTQHQSISGVRKVTETKTKKTTKAAKPIDLAQLAKMMGSLTPEQVAALLGGKK